MTATHEHEELHDLVDRLSPDQARHLRGLVDADPELADVAQTPSGSTDAQPEAPRRFSVTGIWDSGRSDLSVRHDEIIRERLKRTA